MYYNQRLAKALGEEERIKTEIYAEAQKELQGISGAEDVSFLLKIVKSNKTIPVIIEKEGEKPEIANLKFDEIKCPEDSVYVSERLAEMKKQKGKDAPSAEEISKKEAAINKAEEKLSELDGSIRKGKDRIKKNEEKLKGIQ